MKVTAETITDEQILRLLADSTLAEKSWCLAGMRVANTPAQKRQRMKARSRCATMWNARHGGD